MDIPSSSGLRSPGLSKNRGRWLGNDPSSYATVYAMLVATEMHDEPASAQLSEARHPIRMNGFRSLPPSTERMLACLDPWTVLVKYEREWIHAATATDADHCDVAGGGRLRGMARGRSC